MTGFVNFAFIVQMGMYVPARRYKQKQRMRGNEDEVRFGPGEDSCTRARYRETRQVKQRRSYFMSARHRRAKRERPHWVKCNRGKSGGLAVAFIRRRVVFDRRDGSCFRGFLYELGSHDGAKKVVHRLCTRKRTPYGRQKTWGLKNTFVECG
jgi:hypothetical protein